MLCGQMHAVHDLVLQLRCKWDTRSSGILCIIVAVCYRSFGTTYRSHFKSPWRWRRRIVTKCRKQTSTLTARPLKIGPTSCSETSVTNYPTSLGKIAVERRSKMHTQFWWGYFRESASWKSYGSNKPVLCILPCIWERKMKYLVYGTYVTG
jgi:hypothetical protein